MTKLVFLVAVGAALLSGCGLISSDVTNFDLTLPDKEFSVDAASWEVSQEELDTLQSIDCSGNPNVCASAAQTACPMNCESTCNAATSSCDLTLGISLYQTIDLLAEKPELQQINDEPVIKVTIDSVEWAVTANTLNTATPPLQVFVAPMSVMDPNSPDAREIGTIEGIEPGETTAEPRAIAFTATGKAELIEVMSTFKTPFNIIVGSEITVVEGDPVPQGRLDAVVRIKAHAGL